MSATALVWAMDANASGVMSAADRLVLSWRAELSHMQGDGDILDVPTAEKIVHFSGLSEAQVTRALVHLKGSGALDRLDAVVAAPSWPAYTPGRATDGAS